ncbi:MAG: hypothetical protein QF735_09130, partial [Phycisphaeraceae bacterium]|nr:hypothetical protein [Phycisphaeraceae bacterium]
YHWDQAKVTNALTPEQKEILEKRGVLSPDEIHRLASKTKSAMSDTDDSDASLDANKPTCHSDHLDANEAKELQQDQLVQLDVRPAVGLSKEDSVI